MITYEEVRPGDTFVRRNARGFSELRRVLPDGTSELVKLLHAEPEVAIREPIDFGREATSPH